MAFLSDQAIPIEVELANKSKTRLDAILKLHLRWIIARKSSALIYICGDEEGCRRIERAGRRVGLYPTSRSLRIELLETIKAQTLTEFEQSRAGSQAAA